MELPPVNIYQETVHHFHFPAGDGIWNDSLRIDFSSISQPFHLMYIFVPWMKKRISLVEPFFFPSSFSAKTWRKDSSDIIIHHLCFLVYTHTLTATGGFIFLCFYENSIPLHLRNKKLKNGLWKHLLWKFFAVFFWLFPNKGTAHKKKKWKPENSSIVHIESAR